MNNDEYILNCIRTEAPITDAMRERFNTKRNIRLIHGAMGLQTESSEMTDALKKHLFYGKELDITNVREEIQDCLWYISLIMDELGMTYEEAMITNIDKLKARFPEKFTEYLAENRDLVTERKILEA
jgi:NTP pyrophosphatase (non-canonical NTP hydrolase)